MRETNADKALRLLATGPMAGFQIGEEMGVCSPSALQTLRNLCDMGWVVQRGETLGRVHNQPAKLYWLADEYSRFVANGGCIALPRAA